MSTDHEPAAVLEGTVHAATWGSTWHAALEALELDIAETEAMILRLHREADHVPVPRTPWQPPAGLGPLPPGLADRARALLERQARVAEQITRAMVGNRRQQKLAATLHQGPDAAPVYVDTSA